MYSTNIGGKDELNTFHLRFRASLDPQERERMASFLKTRGEHNNITTVQYHAIQ